MSLRNLACLCAIGLWACAGADPDPSDAGSRGRDAATLDAAMVGDAGTVSVEIGVPGGSDGLHFEPLEPGAELRLQTFGQGGTHLMLGVRCHGFGSRAFVTIVLRNLETGAEAISPAPVRPQLLWCHDEVTCDLVPLLAMTAGLVAPDVPRDGVRIEVIAQVRNEAGFKAEASQQAVLSTADL